jgi:hypothetical protein
MSGITANVSGGRVYTLPDASGTLALTSDLGAYLPLSGGTLTGGLNGVSSSFTGGVTGQRMTILADSVGVVLQGYVSDALRIAVLGSDYNNGARGGLLASYGDFSGAINATTGTFLSGSSSTIGLIVGGAGGSGSTRQGQIRFGDAGSVYKIQGGEDYGAFNFMIGSGTPLSLASTGAATFSSTARVEGQFVQIVNATDPTLFLNNTVVQWRKYIKSNNNVAFSDAVRDVLTLGYNGSPSFFEGGNVGIGTASPNARLEITSNSPSSAEVQRWSYNTANPDFSLRLRQDVSSGLVKHVFDVVNDATTYSNNLVLTNGNVGIGTASPGAKLEIKQGASEVPFIIDSSSDSNAAYTLYQVNGSGGWETGMARAADGYAYLFSYGSFGVSNSKLTLTNGGNLLLSTASNDFGSRQVNYSLTSYTFHSVRTGTGSEGHLVFSNGNGVVGSIFTNGMATFYNATSDYRIKEDLQEIKGLEKVQAIKVYDYKWKGSDSRMDGVLAHELAEVLPYAVTGEKDEQDENGNDKMQSVDYSKIVPILIKAIQEQQEQIDSLKNQIQTK